MSGCGYNRDKNNDPNEFRECLDGYLTFYHSTINDKNQTQFKHPCPNCNLDKYIQHERKWAKSMNNLRQSKQMKLNKNKSLDILYFNDIIVFLLTLHSAKKLSKSLNNSNLVFEPLFLKEQNIQICWPWPINNLKTSNHNKIILMQKAQPLPGFTQAGKFWARKIER